MDDAPNQDALPLQSGQDSPKASCRTLDPALDHAMDPALDPAMVQALRRIAELEA